MKENKKPKRSGKSLEDYEEEKKLFPELFIRSKVDKYSKDLCEKLISHMGKGFSYESFAACIGVGYQTLETWAEKHKEFEEAKELAFAQNLLFWENAGIIGMASRGFNTQTWIFNMKNRHGWKDYSDVNVNQKDPEKMTKREVMAELKELSKELIK